MEFGQSVLSDGAAMEVAEREVMLKCALWRNGLFLWIIGAAESDTCQAFLVVRYSWNIMPDEWHR